MLKLDKKPGAINTDYALQIHADVDTVWKNCADTARLNRALDFGTRHEYEIQGIRKVEEKVLGYIPQEWAEPPWQWVRQKFVYIRRIFMKGMSKDFEALFEVNRLSEASSELRLRYVFLPRGFLWGFFLKITMPSVAKKMALVIKRQSEIDTQPKKDNAVKNDLYRQPKTLALTPIALASLQIKKMSMINNGVSEKLIDLIIVHLTQSDEIELNRIRPKALATVWHISTEDVIRAFLYATSTQLTMMSWDVVCPHCRGTRQSLAGLSQLSSSEYCKPCELEFKIDAPNALEITFKPHPSVRKVGDVLYCVADAAKQDHILVQKILAPHQTVLFFSPPNNRSPLRVRITGLPDFYVTENTSGGRLIWDGTRFNFEKSDRFEIQNGSEQEQHFVVENLWWREDVLRPGEVLALKEYRTLFKDDFVAAGVRIDLGEQTILFTDVVGSTKMYEEVGDAKAFKAVFDHFKLVFAVIEKRHGVIVKTIGDSVMASFADPKAAIEAAFDIHEMIIKSKLEPQIRLRISIHKGLVFGVNMNVGIDFFGGTVNVSAKLQACAGANETAISEYLLNALIEQDWKVPSNVDSKKMTLAISGRPQPKTITVYKTKE